MYGILRNIIMLMLVFVSISNTKLLYSQDYNLKRQFNILVLPFNYSNISESTAFSLSNQLADLIDDNIRLSSISPLTIEETFFETDPTLINCTELFCGLTIAESFKADFILVTTLDYNNSYYKLNITLTDIRNQETVLNSQQTIAHQQLENNFLMLSQTILNNIPQWSNVVKSDESRAIINIGIKSGIKTGDQLIIYGRFSALFDSEVTNINELQDIPIAVIEIDIVNENTSSGRYLYFSMPPYEGDKVLYYGAKNTQLSEIENARKIIDKYKIKTKFTMPSTRLYSSIVEETLIDYGKIEWIKRVRELEKKREIYRWITIGSSAVLVGLFATNVDNLLPYVAVLAGGGYSFYVFQDTRSKWQDAVDEGKYKGYIDPQWLPQSNNIDKNTINLFSINKSF